MTKGARSDAPRLGRCAPSARSGMGTCTVVRCVAVVRQFLPLVILDARLVTVRAFVYQTMISYHYRTWYRCTASTGSWTQWAARWVCEGDMCTRTMCVSSNVYMTDR